MGNRDNEYAGGGHCKERCPGGCLLDLPMPKHIPFPDYNENSELLNELFMFLFTACAATMQFINIFRAIWWLPDNYVNHTVNTHLIDPHLIVIILLMTARRLIYCLILRCLTFIERNSRQRLYRDVIKYTYVSILLLSLSYCIAQLYMKNTIKLLLFMSYPFILYLIIFGLHLEPFLRSSCEVEGAYFNEMPLHSCTNSPTAIRDEIEMLREDFNNRFKQVIFTSVINAYYAGFVPCFHATTIYYNMCWANYNIISIWLTLFTMSTVFLFPSKYSDILHRASLHLGYWMRLDDGIDEQGQKIGIPMNALVWNKHMVCTNGSIVKHSGELYRSLGPLTVAQPENLKHSRFYRLFHDPSPLYLVLSSLQSTITIVNILVLYFITEWHFILSISFITLTNQYVFFKLLRDYLVMRSLYSTETSTCLGDRRQSSHSH